MNCQALRENLLAFIDGEASPSVREGIQRHLTQCAECQKELRAIQSLNSALDALPDAPVPATFFRETARKARRLIRPGERFVDWWRQAGLAWRAAACAAMVLGMLSGSLVSNTIYSQAGADLYSVTVVSIDDNEPSLASTYGRMISAE